MRLLRLVAATPERQAIGLSWSRWRRRHQATARGCQSARRARSHPPPMTHLAMSIQLAGVPPLDDALADHLLALLPPAAPQGRPRVNPRQMLSGIVWVMRTGRSWREIPPTLGPWATVYSRYRLWHRDGTWHHIAAVLAAASREVAAAS